MNIPEARERALRESLEMLVDFGRVCLRRRRMQAAGGSKSLELGADFEGVVVAVVVVVVVVVVGAAAVAVAAADGCCSAAAGAAAVVVAAAGWATAAGCSLSAMVMMSFEFMTCLLPWLVWRVMWFEFRVHK